MEVNGRIGALGRAMAELSDEALAERPGPSASERLGAIRRERARRSAARRRRWIGLPVALAALLAVTALLLSPSRVKPLGFAIGDAMAPGVVGVWVSGPTREPTVLTFSDGSRIHLRAGAQARVVSTTGHGARIVVERGSVQADVVPRSGNDWWIVGGPFEIHVTGTSFDASWEAEREVLHVTMYEGHVDVLADCLPHVRSLSQGESATVSCLHEAKAAGDPSAVAVEAPPVPRPASSTTDGPAARRVVSSGATAVPEPPSAPSWRAWARLSSYKEALAAAETEGFSTLCGTLSEAELLDLATTARLAGNAARAIEAYSAVRSRFAGSDGAATAAFHLGQIAFDGAGSYADAHRWFATYLAERPSGALAAEALGRTMEAEQRLGDLASARSTAARYLSRYPTGAHARLARSLLSP